MSQHYDGIPAGVVGEFLERQGFGERKRVANGWLNLRVLFLSRASAPASTRARADKNAQGSAAWSCGQAVPMRRTSCARVRHPRARAFPQAREPMSMRGAIPSLFDTFLAAGLSRCRMRRHGEPAGVYGMRAHSSASAPTRVAVCLRTQFRV